MLRFAPWKFASVLALVLVAMLLVVPSFLPADLVDTLAARVPSFVPLRPIVLGLDLQGGAHMLMEVDSRLGDQGAGRGAARRRARQDARRQDRDQRRHRDAAARRSRAHRRPGRAGEALGLLQALSSRSAARSSGGTAIRSTSPTTGSGAIQLTLTDAAITDKVTPRRDASRSRFSTAASTAPAPRRPTSSSRAPTASSSKCPACRTRRKLKEMLGPTAKLNFQLVADPGDPPNEVETLPMQQGGGTITVREADHGRRRRPRRRPAGLRLSAPANPTSIFASICAAASISARSPPRTSAGRSPSCSTAR